MPPAARFTAEDEALLIRFAPSLAELEERLIRGFYDVLFGHPETARILSTGERSEREKALRRWWSRTLQGPFDARYWQWQAAVGLVHIRQNVTNPMMIGMWGWLLNALQGELLETLRLLPHEAARLMEAFHRLAATAQALTAESYLRHYLIVLSRSTGVSTELIDRLVAVELSSFDPSAEA
ncbi:Globin domain [Methylacidimicrobium sp. AP8]|nr:Globin domain [Methylacidimicrobium sp. AP8]